MTNDTIERILALSDEQVRECAGRLMIGGGTRGGPILLRGKGTRVWDTRGKSYIDCTAQSWALYLGYCNDEIWDAINQQAQYLTHVHQGFDTLPRFYLAKLLTDIAPASLNRVSFCPSSALALEGGMKIALKNRPGAAQFVTLWDGYHGTTLGTMGGSWIATKSSGQYAGGSRFLPLLHPTVRAPNPYCYRCYFGQQPENCDLMCAKMLELTLDKGVTGPPAGVIVEPLQASAGMIPCPKRYLERVREICDQRDLPLIFDEIQTYLRIGAYFAAQHYGVTPDIIGLGKAIGGGLPLGATLIRDGLAGFDPDAEELHTFAANTLSIVGAIKLIEIVQRDKLLDHTNRMGSYFRKALTGLQKDYPEIGDIRQVGLHIGIELVADPQTKRPLDRPTRQIRDVAMRRGAIFGLAGVRKNLLKIKPPLIIQQDEADEVLAILGETLREVLRK